MDRQAPAGANDASRRERPLADPLAPATAAGSDEQGDLTRELAEREAQLAEAQAIARLGSWATDARTATSRWSDEMYRIHGLPPSRPAPRLHEYLHLVHPDERDAVANELLHALQERRSYETEYRIVRPDGETRWVQGRGTPIVEDGSVVRVHGTVQDISERKASEQALAERERRLRQAQRIAHLGHWRWSLVTEELAWSEELYHLAGLDPASFEPTYEAVLELIHPDDRQGYVAAVGPAVRSEEPFEHEYRVVRPDGETRWIYNWAQVVRDESGDVVAFEGVSQDVTALKTAQERYRLVSELTSDVAYSYHLDPTGQVVVEWMTGGMEQVTGYTSEEAVALGGWLGMLLEDELPRYTERLQRIFEGEQVDAEFRIRAKSGETRWVWISARPEVDPDTGEVLRVDGAARDVTEQRAAEEALAESEARLREAQAVGHVGSWEWDTDADRTAWSEEVCSFLGVAPEEAPADLASFLAFVHPEDRERVVETAEHLRRVGSEVDGDFRLVRADGAVRWILARGAARRDPAGRIVAVLGTFQDVTERREQEERYRAISEMISDAAYAFRVDEHGVAHPEWITASFQRLTGYLDEDVIDLLARWRDYVHPDDHEAIIRSVKHALEGNEDVCEYRLTTASGEQRWIEARARPVVEDGRITRVYGAAQDVTEQRVAEEALRSAYERERDAAARLRAADRMKDEFLATASHELRTPLTSIVGFASALARQADELDDATRAQLLGKLERNALELGEMVERLLDFSRLQAGNVQVKHERLSLHEVVGACLESHVAASIADHRVETVGPDAEVAADRAALTHVLANLLTNAAKYSPPGSTIRLAARRAGDHVVVGVRDQGIGIDPEHQQRIFDRFFRGPDQPPGTRGSGIGLAIARSYVDLMGGQLWVDSSPGEGSTFCFSLPLAETSASR